MHTVSVGASTLHSTRRVTHVFFGLAGASRETPEGSAACLPGVDILVAVNDGELVTFPSYKMAQCDEAIIIQNVPPRPRPTVTKSKLPEPL